MKKSIYFLVLFLLLSCSPRSLKIGVAVPLSGSGTGRGQEILNAALLAVEEINHAGGVKGRKLELIVKDDKDLPETGKMVANELLQEGVLGVIGHYSSDVTLAVLPQYISAKTSLISPSVTLSKVPEEGRYFFRTLANNTAQAGVASDFIHFSNYQRIGIVSNNSVYGNDLADELSKSLSAFPEIQIKRFKDIADVDVFSEILSSTPELVFYAGGYRDSALFLQRLHEAGSQAEFMGGNTLFENEFIRLAGLVHIGKVWVIASPNRQENIFYSAYEQRFGPPGYIATHAYDAVKLLAKAIKDSPRLEPSHVAETLQSIDSFDGVSGLIRPGGMGREKNEFEQSVWLISSEGRFEPYEPTAPLSTSAGQVIGAWADAALP